MPCHLRRWTTFGGAQGKSLLANAHLRAFLDNTLHFETSKSVALQQNTGKLAIKRALGHAPFVSSTL